MTLQLELTLRLRPIDLRPSNRWRKKKKRPFIEKVDKLFLTLLLVSTLDSVWDLLLYNPG